METLPTGISVLDREFGGGLPSGSVVVLKADPASQSELILDRFSRVRSCRYLTTVRPAAAVTDALTLDPTETDRIEVRDAVDEGTLDAVLTTASDVPEHGTVIIDSIEPLEANDRAAYRDFLNDLRRAVKDVDAVVLVHALKDGTRDPTNRVVTEQIADIVFDLRTTVTGAEIVNRLIVPKFRGGAALAEPLKLKLTDNVTIDTSRDIA